MVLVQDYSIHHAVPYSKLEVTLPLPDKRLFPKELQTVGNHIKAARLSRNVLIKSVCKMLNISRETLRGWELGDFEPHVSHYPAIITFLGYNPCKFETDAIAGKIKDYRYRHGLTQQEFADLLNTQGSVVWQWECNGRIPLPRTEKRILDLIEKP